MSIFDQILAQYVPDESDREVVKKHPGFVSAVEEIAKKNETNQAWFQAHYDAAENKTIREKELEAIVRQQSERIAAGAASGSDMNFDEILAGLQAKGFVNSDALNAKIGEVEQKVATTVNNRDQGVLKFYADTANLAVLHKEEFGEPLDSNGFVQKYMENPTAGARTVYDNFVHGMREAKRTAEMVKMQADQTAAIEKARQEGLEAGRRAAAMEAVQAQGGMPVDQGRGSGSASMGWMQKRQLERTMAKDADGNQAVPGGKLGDGSATAAIMAQIAKDMADGKLQVQ